MVQSLILGRPGPNAVGNDVGGVADEDGTVSDPREPLDVLDHLQVVVGSQVRLVLAAVGHREQAHEVGEPGVRASLQLGVLVPVVVDVPRLVADDEVVAAVLDDLLEHHEVGDQDLVHASEGLEAVEVVAGRLRGDVGRLGGEPLACRVDRLTIRLQHRGDGMLGQPLDLDLGAEPS